MSGELSYTHRFEPGTRSDATPILLLHGTGGNENDLIDIGRRVAPGAALLSPRGNVLENGMARFFRRFGESLFDEDDVRRRAGDLADFIVAARRKYDLAPLVALGYSNGANIAAAMLLLRPDALAGAILLRAMTPFSEPPQADLSGKPVLILSGGSDPIIPAENSARLAAVLERAGADVRYHRLAAGHNLIEDDFAVASDWLRMKAHPSLG
ncbi:alpha/beta hydrolase [soil metagenome]